MNRFLSLCFCVCAVLLSGCRTGTSTSVCCPACSSVPQDKHDTYILVHGAWGGGWDWKNIDHLLTADGNTVYRPTLTGLGEHSNLDNTNIDLETHIEDIVNVIVWENLHDVVLAGHSYGGMVITGVADRVPDRIKRLVYIDAFLPENGDSVEKPFGWPKIPIKDGYLTVPWLTNTPPPPHDVLMPARAFSQPINLTNQAVALELPATYILAVDPGTNLEQAHFYLSYCRAKSRGWPLHVIASDHNVQRSHPHELVKFMEASP